MNKFRAWLKQLKEMTLTEFLFHYGKQLGILTIVMVAGLSFLIYFLASDSPPSIKAEEPTTVLGTTSSENMSLSQVMSSDSAISSNATSSESVQWYVDVKGAVASPQVYPVEEDMRVHDVIEMAGGLTMDADGSRLNFSQRVSDQMVIYVPTIDEEVPADIANLTEQSQVTNTVSEDGNKLININSADATELQEISGVGEKKAADIIAYREANGSFATVDDLIEVSGIGEKSLEKMRSQVTVE